MKEEEKGKTPVVSTYNKDNKHFWAAFLNLARHNINIRMRYLLSLIIVILTLISIEIYYKYERLVPFEYVTSLPKFHNCYFRDIDYIDSEKRMHFCLVDFYKKKSCQKAGLTGYKDEYITVLSRKIDFTNYDYILSYTKKIKILKYSPYLTKKHDNLYFDKRIPLIAEYLKGEFDSIFIYKIRKTGKFRAPGP